MTDKLSTNKGNRKRYEARYETVGKPKAEADKDYKLAMFHIQKEMPV